MQKEPLGAGAPASYSGFFTDAHWWFFCLLILVLNFLLLAVDPLPKLFMGDSQSYLWTAWSGWIPPDRSFLYGYVIRWSSFWTESLTSLLVLQAFLGAVTAILVALVCRLIFGLVSGLSYLFGLLCSLDPLQLVWERYVMTETVSLFFYVLVLLFSLLYLKQRRLWQLAIVQSTVGARDKLQDELFTRRSDQCFFVTAHSFPSRNSRSVSEAFLHIIEEVWTKVGGIAPGIQHSAYVCPATRLCTTQREARRSRTCPSA